VGSKPWDEMKKKQRPVIRVIHHLARSGGTVISKCLATMDRVVLLSEIHPAAVRTFDPLRQAHEWYDLLTPGDLARIRKGGVDFRSAMALIARRCVERGKILVVRDWTHIDFTGTPFVSAPSYRLRLVEALTEGFSVLNTASVRHPVDQWLSLRRLAVVHGKLSLEDFLRGYRRFAERCSGIGFARYEDFTCDPDAQLRILCQRLRIPFDPGYRQRWASYTNITGARGGNRVETEIVSLPRRAVEPGLLEAFEANEDYRRTIELLGYGHPQ
jgi:protein O-GlcNAc transferase